MQSKKFESIQKVHLGVNVSLTSNNASVTIVSSYARFLSRNETVYMRQLAGQYVHEQMSIGIKDFTAKLPSDFLTKPNRRSFDLKQVAHINKEARNALEKKIEPTSSVWFV